MQFVLTIFISKLSVVIETALNNEQVHKKKNETKIHLIKLKANYCCKFNKLNVNLIITRIYSHPFQHLLQILQKVDYIIICNVRLQSTYTYGIDIFITALR